MTVMRRRGILVATVWTGLTALLPRFAHSASKDKAPNCDEPAEPGKQAQAGEQTRSSQEGPSARETHATTADQATPGHVLDSLRKVEDAARRGPIDPDQGIAPGPRLKPDCR